DAGAGAGTRKRGVFREEAITRMKCVAADAARHVDQLVNTEIAFTRRSGADCVSFVGQPDVQRFAVDLAKNGNGLNAEFAARANTTHGDLPAIGNQDFLEHRKEERGKSVARRKRSAANPHDECASVNKSFKEFLKMLQLGQK